MMDIKKILKAHKKWIMAGCRGPGQADFRHADLSGVRLYGACLKYIDFSYANLSHSSILMCDFGGSVLFHTNCSYADLSGSNFSRINMSHCIVSNANLLRANLTGTWLCDTTMYNAWMAEVTMTEAQIRGANLTGATLTGAKGVICAGTDPRGHRFVGVRHDAEWMVAAECLWFKISEAKAHWGSNSDALARIAVIEAN